MAIGTLLLFSCAKETIKEDLAKSEIYVLNGKEYVFSYSEDAESGERKPESTADNEELLRFISEHDEEVFVHLANDSRCYLFADMSEFSANRAKFLKEIPVGSNVVEKTSNNFVQSIFYEHANFGTPMFTHTANIQASTVTNNPLLIDRVSTLIGSNWGSARIFYNDWVGTSANDKISSIESNKTTSTTKGSPWNYYVVAIYEDLNYGGSSHLFIDSDSEIPLRTTQSNLQNVSMGAFNNFNDEISSYWGGTWY